MRVFVTGASGFVGQAVCRELLDAGHQVVGLARSDTSVAKLEAAGVEPWRGSLEQPDRIVEAVRAAEGVIHLAFIHDFSAYQQSIETEIATVGRITAAMEGSGKPLVYTSAIGFLKPGTVSDEDSPLDMDRPSALRAAGEVAALAAAERGVRVSAVRLPPSTHGVGDQGFVPVLIEVARQKGFAGYVGDGANRWPACHRTDAARLYRLALEQAEPGAILHAVAEEGVPMRDIAGAIARKLGQGTPRSVPMDEAFAHFGWIGMFVGGDLPASSAKTRAVYDWRPSGPDLLADIADPAFGTDGSLRI